MSDAAIAAASAAGTSQTAPPAPASNHTLWAHGGFSFKDLLDIVNPLQHLPIVGSIYRYLTGDEPSGGARIVGDALYGGPIGLGVGVVSTLLTDSQGHDLGERVLADVFGPPSSSTTLGTPKTAAATPASPAVAQTAAVPSSNDPTAMAAVLFHSPPPAASTPAAAPGPETAATFPAATPEQNFLALNARLRREFARGQSTSSRQLNNHPVPLELSSGLLPVNHPSSAPVPPAAQGTAAPAPANVPNDADATAALNPIAQKMLDALAKYSEMKKQEEQQQDSDQKPAAPKVDLSL